MGILQAPSSGVSGSPFRIQPIIEKIVAPNTIYNIKKGGKPILSIYSILVLIMIMIMRILAATTTTYNLYTSCTLISNLGSIVPILYNTPDSDLEEEGNTTNNQNKIRTGGLANKAHLYWISTPYNEQNSVDVEDNSGSVHNNTASTQGGDGTILGGRFVGLAIVGNAGNLEYIYLSIAISIYMSIRCLMITYPLMLT